MIRHKDVKLDDGAPNFFLGWLPLDNQTEAFVVVLFSIGFAFRTRQRQGNPT